MMALCLLFLCESKTHTGTQGSLPLTPLHKALGVFCGSGPCLGSEPGFRLWLLGVFVIGFQVSSTLFLSLPPR